MVIGTPTVLNLIPGGVMKVIHVNQVNENIEIQFRIMNGAQPFNVPEGVSCTIRGTKGDNFGYAADVAVTAGSNIVTVTLTEQLTAVAGAGNIFELVFVGASDDMKVSTENFLLDVERAALGEDTVISDSDLAYADQVLDQLQSVGAVNAQVQQNKANIAAEITRATAAEQTLQSNINAEASSRATTDASLQSQINQLVAPSGSAPSAAEVENARIGSDGTVYHTLGDAIRTQNSLLKSHFDALAVAGINLLDTTAVTLNKYMKGDGTVEDREYIFYTDYIPITKNQTLIVPYSSKVGNSHIVLYNSSKSRLGAISGVKNGNYVTYTASNLDSIAWGIINGEIDKLETMMIIKGTVYPDLYCPYNGAALQNDISLSATQEAQVDTKLDVEKLEVMNVIDTFVSFDVIKTTRETQYYPTSITARHKYAFVNASSGAINAYTYSTVDSSGEVIDTIGVNIASGALVTFVASANAVAIRSYASVEGTIYIYDLSSGAVDVIRGEISDVNDKCDDLLTTVTFNFTTYPGYILSNGGIATQDANNKEVYTDSLLVTEGSVVTIEQTFDSKQNGWFAYALYDSNGRFISRIVADSGYKAVFSAEITIPNGASFVRFTYRTFDLQSVVIIRRYANGDDLYAPKMSTSEQEYGLKDPMFVGNKVQFLMHRGLSAQAPENTIPAFTLAGQYGAFGIETDIYESTDGEFFCFHDATVDRMTDGEGYIYQKTATEIRALNIDSGNNIFKYSGLKIPTLKEYLVICKKYGCVPIIELKYIQNFDNLVDAVNDFGMGESSIFIGNLEYANRLRTAGCHALYAYVIGSGYDLSTALSEVLQIENCTIDLGVPDTNLTEDVCNAFHEHNLPVLIWLCETEEAANEYASIGVDLLTSNSITKMSLPGEYIDLRATVDSLADTNVNLFDKTSAVLNKIMNDNGTESDAVGKLHTSVFSIHANETIITKYCDNVGLSTMVLYNASLVRLGAVYGVRSGDYVTYTATGLSSIAYGIINSSMDELNTLMIVKGTSYPESYSPYNAVVLQDTVPLSKAQREEVLELISNALSQIS